MSIVYLLCGLPGSGKTTYAKKLENKNTIRFTLDEEFFKRFGQDFDKKKYPELESQAIGEIVKLAENLIAENKNVILDFGFWKKNGREKERARFEKLGAEVRLVFVKMEKEIRYRRVENRDKVQQHDLNLEALEKFEREFEAPGKDEIFEVAQ